MRPKRGTTNKQECDALRARYAEVLAGVNLQLTKTNAEIQGLTDPDELVETMKGGYLEALGLMCGTMDYTNNIQMLSRMTKQLKTLQLDPQDAENVDIFGRIEKLSYDFILRLRQHEMEHTHVEERIAGVSKEQEAIQRSIMHQLASYEQQHRMKYGDNIPDELNFARYFQLA